ncbi:MAG: arsenate reductase ArsC [Lysobacterales bacterium]
MTDRVFNVLFLCTGNSARSILAEALLNHLGEGRFRAYSAGSNPRGEVHPLALETLRRFELPIEGLRSKSWDEFEQVDAPTMDFIFTVCDNAAGEACPLWLGHPVTAHWGIADPAAVEGFELECKAAFATAFGYLRKRISAFVALPMQRLDPAALRSQLQAIGAGEGASSGRASVQVVSHD